MSHDSITPTSPDKDQSVTDRIAESEVFDKITSGAADLLEEQKDRHIDTAVEWVLENWPQLIEKVKSRRLRWLLKLVPIKLVSNEVAEFLIEAAIALFRGAKDRVLAMDGEENG